MQMNGPIEIVYAVTAVFVLLSILFFNGKCSWLIAGYNTASKAEKAKYDETKLCKVYGYACGVIALLLLITCFIWHKVPYYFSYILAALIIIDGIIALILANTICKKQWVKNSLDLKNIKYHNKRAPKRSPLIIV